ncbi:hypothetical protein BJY01DRAFT_107960 [Aspergillus pseudoustus]|uniref:Arrestin C-terminal-like domain-containing protein n=1 Tax=Aspergillus pseudoustus TaxID=1810923 RepID=A0ABR4IUZ5_9EURO
MDVWDLRLTVPDVHYLLEPCDVGEAPPLSGVVAVAVPASSLSVSTSSIPQITVSLLRCVKLRKFGLTTTTRYTEPKQRTKRFWKQTSPVRQTLPPIPQTSQVQRQTLVLHNTCHAPDEIEHDTDEHRAWLKFNFHFPVPNNLPGTLDTIGGAIYYTIEAAISSSELALSQQSLRVSQPLKIQYYSRPTTISHLRRYPGDIVTTELQINPSSAQKGVSYSAEWLARSTVVQGARPSDVKYVVAKELHWSIEESVKCVAITEDSTSCIHQYARLVSEGILKGRWVASGESGRGDSIRIPFDINIPPSTSVPDTTTVSAYQDHHSTRVFESHDEMLAVTVDHRLNLEVVVGEDTFHRGTGDLLDRRYPVKSYKATFPLLIRQLISEDLPSLAGVGVTPPRYEELYVAPPRYGGS